MRRRLLWAVLAGLLLLATAPARAEDPVLDDADRAELAAALAEATAVQHVCYGYDLQVSDHDGGRYEGLWQTSNLGAGIAAEVGPACPATVVLHAGITYTSSSSESEDDASWRVESTLAGPTTGDLDRLGLSASSLLSDKKAATTLYNAVLALPGLTADAGLAPPLQLDTDAEPVPPDAAATGHPGSDWWRENGGAFALLTALLVGAGVWASTTTPDGHRRARAVLRALSD